jgi:hypothetical protein
VREIVESLEKEYRGYKVLAERTFEQLTAEQLTLVPAAESKPVAAVAWHISGNLKSRFTDFRTTDGEKPWRDRESEFDARQVGHDDLRRRWEDGWSTLFAAPYHRGQVATRLRERGGEPPLTDFIAWIWMHRPAPDGESVDGA